MRRRGLADGALILVSNDDGYRAAGLAVLAEALEGLGEVWVVAPDRERSGVGHAITLHEPLRVVEYAPRRYHCSGTPTDAVYIGVNHLAPRHPDLLVSGVNHGANLGEDVTYSGTVAAAMEGVLLDVPSLAVSLAFSLKSVADELRKGDGVDYRPAAAVAVAVAREVLARGLPPCTLLNLNVPHPYDPAVGVRITRLGRRRYERLVDERADPRGGRYYWIGGPDIGFRGEPGTDCEEIRHGAATLTPLDLDMTHRTLHDTLKTWPFDPTER